MAVGNGGDTGSVLGEGVETAAGVKVAVGLVEGEGVGDLEQAKSSPRTSTKDMRNTAIRKGTLLPGAGAIADSCSSGHQPAYALNR